MFRRCASSSSPTMPVSMKVMSPVCRLTRMLPGCGSAWKKPSISTCLSMARRAFLASTSRSKPGLVDGREVADFDPADELHGQDLDRRQLRVHLAGCARRG